jgi:hemerythrin superfamily protein
MRATDLLEKQHRKVEATFKKLESGKGDLRALVISLANDLAAHMVIEQEIFYPKVKSIKPDLVLESYEEHAIAEFALERLIATKPGAESFQARVTALKELIQHHVEEEESDLFPKVNKAMKDELDAMGKAMKARFEEAVEAGYASALVEAKQTFKKPSNGARTNDVQK